MIFMPNICLYSMCVKGKRKNVEEFIKVIKADYNYNTMQFSYDRHLFRVFEAHYEEIESLGRGMCQAVISGDCAWSVSSCMFNNNPISYYARLKREYGDNFRGTTLPLESTGI